MTDHANESIQVQDISALIAHIEGFKELYSIGYYASHSADIFLHDLVVLRSEWEEEVSRAS